MSCSAVLLYNDIFPPSQFSRLTQLTYLELSTNSLSGPIASSVSINDSLGYPDVMPLGMHRFMSVYTITMVCQHDHIAKTCCIYVHVIGVCIYIMQCMDAVDALASVLAFLLQIISDLNSSDKVNHLIADMLPFAFSDLDIDNVASSLIV